MTTSAPTRPILRYHGGKWTLAKWVISHFPPHRIYVEPFMGAGSVLLQKPRSHTEVLNDKYDRVVNVFRVLRNPKSAKKLRELLRLTPCSEVEYRSSREIDPDPIEDARRMIVLGHQSHGSTGCCGGKKSGWRRGIRPHGQNNATEWSNIWGHVERWADRLRSVYLESEDAIETIKRWDSPETLHYVDPPYVLDTRTAAGGYLHEMTDGQHSTLSEILHSVKGMVALSGYQSDLYSSLYAGWRAIEKTHLADKGLERKEVLWLSPNIQPEANLFE